MRSTPPVRLRAAARCALVALLLPLLAVSAAAGLPTHDELEAALVARLTALEDAGLSSKAAKREHRSLGQALKALLAYEEENHKRDLSTLIRVSRRVHSSRTTDTDVVLGLDAVYVTLDQLCGVERLRLTERLEQMDQLVKPQPLLKATLGLSAGDALHDVATATWGGDPGGATRLLARAVKTYRKHAARSHGALLKGAVNDLRVVDLEVPDAVLHASHPTQIVAVTDVPRDTAEVTVTVSIIRRADLDAGLDEPLQYVLGETTATDVEAGPLMEVFDVVVPADAPADEYYVVAEVDPHGRVYEAREDDNLFVDEANVRPVSVEYLGVPNLVLESFEFDPPAIALDTGHLDEVVVGVNVRVALRGSEPLEQVPLAFFIDWEGFIHCVPPPAVGCSLVEPGSALVPVWSSALGAYQEVYLIDRLEPGESRDVHIDFSLTEDTDWAEVFGEDLASLLAGLDAGDPPLEFPASAVRAVVDPLDEIVEYEPLGDDNTAFVASDLQVVRVPDCDMEKRYRKTWSGSNLGVGIDFTAGVDMGPAGAEAGLTGALPVWLLSSTPVELFAFEALTTRDPVDEYGQFAVDVEFAGFTIYSLFFDSDLLDVPGGISVGADGFAFQSEGADGSARWFVSKEWPEDESKRSKTFYPGGYPVEVEMTLEGQVGFELSAEATNTLSFGGGPYVSLGLGLEGKTCFGKKKAKICVGAGGELTLIEDLLKAEAFCEMDVVDTPDSRSIDSALGLRLKNTITSMQGELFVFVEYPWCKVCWKAFIPYPCKCGTKRSQQTLVNWDPLVTVEHVLFEAACETCIPVTGLPDCGP